MCEWGRPAGVWGVYGSGFSVRGPHGLLFGCRALWGVGFRESGLRDNNNNSISNIINGVCVCVRLLNVIYDKGAKPTFILVYEFDASSSIFFIIASNVPYVVSSVLAKSLFKIISSR